MKFGESWLREWVNPKITTEELTDQLTMAGLEVDSVSKLADEFSGVVVGEIVECGKHPDADKLSICKVAIGEGEPLPIVCGGSNVRVGLKIALATVGAVLPGNFKIKKSKLRGQPSHGMICAARELGIDEPETAPKAIMELPEEAPLGQDLREYYLLDDNVIDIELTPNRGDCASIRGIAREIGVLNNVKVAAPKINLINSSEGEQRQVHLRASQACSRYAGCIVRGINSNAVTPRWMMLRLEQAGIRCIHPVVDVCNYVMIELGQPMHGFDLATLKGDINVRLAKKNEKLKLLDEQEIELQATDLVIADSDKPQALAGIMGGFDSAVSEQTQDVFLESAYFDPVVISLAARRLGIVSDSSYRFERGVDSRLQTIALARAAQLLTDIAGGNIGPVVEAVDEAALPPQATINLRRRRIVEMLGVEIKDDEVMRILLALGMTVDTDGQGWMVTVPSYRSDITLEVDLIEELARLFGYNNIPTKHLEAPLVLQRHISEAGLVRRLSDVLVDCSYHEIVTYSFVDNERQQPLNSAATPVVVQNPISSDMNVMRTSMLPGLLQTMQYNQNRQVMRQRLFEVGLCFKRQDKQIEQEAMLGMLAVGEVYPTQWGEAARRVDFYDLKGDFEMVLQALGCDAAFCYEPSRYEALHPGQSADIFLGKECVGYLGVLHPKYVKAFDLRQAPVVLQIKTSALSHNKQVKFEAISKFPSVRRDLALVVDADMPVGKIVQSIKSHADSILSDVCVFDIYSGEGIEKSKKSVALGLTFQDPSRTLVDSDINSVIQNIFKVLKEELQATLRT